MEYGIVKYFSKAKGFGFIIPDGTDPTDKAANVFVHYSAILTGEPRKRNLVIGQRVRFTRKFYPTNAKLCAANVEVVDDTCVHAIVGATSDAGGNANER